MRVSGIAVCACTCVLLACSEPLWNSTGPHGPPGPQLAVSDVDFSALGGGKVLVASVYGAYVIDGATHSIRKVTSDWLPNARMSPDGEVIAYVPVSFDPPSIQLIGSDGTGSRSLSSFGWAQTGAMAWTADASAILIGVGFRFDGTPNDLPGLYRVARDGTQQLLRSYPTGPNGTIICPTFELSGHEIAASVTGKIAMTCGSSIYINGGGSFGGGGEGLTWSPDGSKLTMIVPGAIRILNGETGEILRTIDIPGERPPLYGQRLCWLETGNRLVFTAAVAGRSTVYTVDGAGGTARPVITDASKYEVDSVSCAR